VMFDLFYKFITKQRYLYDGSISPDENCCRTSHYLCRRSV